MREIVIVIADLYLEPQRGAGPAASQALGAAETPAFGELARFGDATTLPEGWRAWTARWLGLPQHARAAPASVAAAALSDPSAGTPSDEPAGRAVWLATPVHWSAGLTSLHCDRRSVLRLPGAELDALAMSFRETFRGSGFDLLPLTSGEFLLSGPALPAAARTIEPARMLLTPVAEALPAGEGASALRRLGAEIDMWLHGHRVNEMRARRGAPPVATLWIWGGGAPALSRPPLAREVPDAAFGSDAYVCGLWRLAGGEARPMPVDWGAVIGEAHAPRALGVLEVAELLHAHPSWHLADAAADIDRRVLSPSLAALRRGALGRLVLLGNDRCLTLRAAQRWRLWRRARPPRTGFEVLA